MAPPPAGAAGAAAAGAAGAAGGFDEGDLVRRLLPLLAPHPQQPHATNTNDTTSPNTTQGQQQRQQRRRVQLLSLLEAGLAQVSLSSSPHPPTLADATAQAALRELVAQERGKLAEEACALLGTKSGGGNHDGDEAPPPPPLLTPEALLQQDQDGPGIGAPNDLLAALLPHARGPVPPPAHVIVTAPAPPAPPPPPPRPQHPQRPPSAAAMRPPSSSGPFPPQQQQQGGGGRPQPHPRPAPAAVAGRPATDRVQMRLQQQQQQQGHGSGRGGGGGGDWQYQHPQQPGAGAGAGAYLRSTAPPPLQPQQHQQPPPVGAGGGGAQSYASKFATAGELRSHQHQQQQRKRPLGGGRGGGGMYEEAWARREMGGGGGGGGRRRRGRYGDEEEEEGGGGVGYGGMGGGRRQQWYGEGEDGEDEEQQQMLLQQQQGFNPRVMKKFVPPVRGAEGHGGNGNGGGGPNIKRMVHRAVSGPGAGGGGGSGGAAPKKGDGGDGDGEAKELPEELKGCDPQLVERIEQEIIDRGDPVAFDDIAGLKFQKGAVVELVCWPLERPDLFTGLRALPKGLLLFGPPGTGKTLIGKAISSQSGATFFSISASSLTSKWIGEGEKMVRTLFKVAAYHQPAIIFIDEVDSLLCQRTSDENEATRRLKTEFLIQLDGCGSSAEDRILVVGATNRPDELDEAARRRFVKRLYIPLPDAEARLALVTLLLRKNSHALQPEEIQAVVERTTGFSGADIKALCTEAAMGPIRDLASGRGGAGGGRARGLSSLSAADVPPIAYRHFLDALASVRPSVGEKDLGKLMQWNEEFGTYPRCHEEGRGGEGGGGDGKENRGPRASVGPV